MSGPIHLYVSSSSDLVVERDAIGQIIAALPVALGWQISHTPLPGSLDVMLDMAELDSRIQDCDLYALALGRDLTAPMGFEVHSVLARGAHPRGARFVGAYLKTCTRSPSAQDAMRTLDLTWQRYSSAAVFSMRFKRDLSRALLDVGPTLGLDLADVEHLLEGQKEEGAEATEESTGLGHAGRSGRILGREVWQGGEPD